MATENQTPAVEAEQDQKRIATLISEAETRARDEEKKKLYSSLENEKNQRIEMQKRLEALESEKKSAELEALKPNERFSRQLSELEGQLKRSAEQASQDRQQYAQNVRAMELMTYRERVLRAYGDQIIPEMVGGNSEQDIDYSAKVSHEQWLQMTNRIRQQVDQEYQLRFGAPTGVPALPPSPYLPPPAVAGGGFPASTNAQPVAEGNPTSLRTLTTEEAVRSGRYGELREQIHDNLRGMQSPGALGSLPRHMASPMPVTHQPGGVVQPMGTPMGPVMNSGIAAPNASQAARDAVARTHAGQNPLVSGDPGARGALSAAQAHGAGAGVTPQSAFAARFAPSPPITNGGN